MLAPLSRNHFLLLALIAIVSLGSFFHFIALLPPALTWVQPMYVSAFLVAQVAALPYSGHVACVGVLCTIHDHACDTCLFRLSHLVCTLPTETILSNIFRT